MGKNKGMRNDRREEKTRNKIKMIVFDGEGTLFDKLLKGSGVWQEPFDILGIPEKHEPLERRFKTNDFSYTDWCHETFLVWRAHGLTEAQFLKIVKRQPFMDGAKEVVVELHRQGYKLGMITGSVNDLAERVQKELGIDEAVAHCNLRFKDGKLDDWQFLDSNYKGKADALVRMAGKFGIEPSECGFVGDGENDIDVMKIAGFSVAFNPKSQKVRDAAGVTVEDKDLRAILRPIELEA